MLYLCEFEFFPSEGRIKAVPRNGLDGVVSGADLQEAFEHAAIWLFETVDDALLHGRELPAARCGSSPLHGGQVATLAVMRSIEDIPCMSASDAARYLGISPARVKQLCDAGLLESWKSGANRLVTKASVETRRAYSLQRETDRASRRRANQAPA